MVRSLGLILLIPIFPTGKALATIYYACGTGNVWDGSTPFLYTSPTCSSASGEPLNPSNTLFVDGDEIIINSGATVTVKGLISLSDAIKITVYGNLFIQINPQPGNLNLTNSSSTIELKSGSELACVNGSGEIINCSNSDQISIGQGGSSFTWKGGDIDILTSPNILTNSGLPIELLTFKASKRNNKVSLSWATASELNFDYFDIEKSADGKDFYSIGKVKGNGTANFRQDYALDDEKPLIGKNYYRLKSVDYDGYTEYFNVVLVDFDGSKGFSIFPNPSEGVSFSAETNFTPQSRAFVVIYTTLGAEVGRYEASGSTFMLTMPAKLESGVYYAKYISNDFTATNRLLVK
jgi:hypothetical protein